jgi:hypothetical protein
MTKDQYLGQQAVDPADSWTAKHLQAVDSKRHELNSEETLIVRTIQRDLEALQNQLRGVLRGFMIVRGIKGNCSLSEDGTYIIEQG